MTHGLLTCSGLASSHLLSLASPSSSPRSHQKNLRWVCVPQSAVSDFWCPSSLEGLLLISLFPGLLWWSQCVGQQQVLAT